MSNVVLLTDTVLHQLNTSVTETELSTVSATLGASDVFRILTIGNLLVNGATETFDILIYLGGTKIIDLGVLSIGTNASRHAYWTAFTVCNRGAQNSQIFHGQLWHGTAGSHGGNAVASGTIGIHGGGLSTIDFSASQAISIRAKHSVSNVSNDYQQLACLVEKVVNEATVGGNKYVASDNTFRDINNTVTESVLGSVAIPAGAMGTKDWLRIWSGINYLNNSGANTHSPTLNVYLGGVQIGSYPILNANTPASANRYGIPISIYIANLAVQNSQAVAIFWQLGTPANTWGTGNQAVTGPVAVSTSAQTIDMSQAQTLEIKVIHDTALATLSAQHYGTFIERLPGL